LVGLKTLKNTKAYKKLQATVSLIIAIAVVINLFGQSFTVRLDLTDANIYSLSASTK